MIVSFVKMHGLGNHFVMINGFTEAIDPAQLPMQKLAHPQTGIGFDQLIIVGPSDKADIRCRFFNADGSEAEQCGNGLRCAVRFALDQKILSKTTISIETLAGISKAETLADNLISVQLGVPIFDPERIPYLATEQKKSYSITTPSLSQPATISVLSLGNPHAVMKVDNVASYPVPTVGAEIATSPVFPHGTNVGFMEIIDRKTIILRTYERGCGETLACGSNSCASVIAAILNGDVDNSVEVRLALGDLIVEWPGLNQAVKLIGPAATIYQGTFATTSFEPNQTFGRKLFTAETMSSVDAKSFSDDVSLTAIKLSK